MTQAAAPRLGSVLVAGATGPIGAAVARELAGRGHRIVAHFHTARERAEALVASLGGGTGRPADGHVAIGADLTDDGAAERIVLEAQPPSAPPLAAVVNCAWPAATSAPLAAPPAVGGTDPVAAVLSGVAAHLALCRATLPSLRTVGGSVVLLGGALATRLHPGLGVYSVGKAAATTATLTLALEEGRHGVRANVIAPGRVDVGDGDLAESDPAYASLDEIGRLRRAMPLPTPEDVARVVAFLVGPDSTAVTGQVIGMAGGEPL